MEDDKKAVACSLNSADANCEPEADRHEAEERNSKIDSLTANDDISRKGSSVGGDSSIVIGETDDPKPQVLLPSTRIAIAAGRIVARRPCASLSSCWAMIVLLTSIGVFTGEIGFTPAGPKDWEVMTSTHSEQRDATDLAGGAVDCIALPDGSCPKTLVRSVPNMMVSLTMIYKSTTGSTAFTPVQLQQMCKIERLVLDNPHYPKFCLLRPESRETTKNQQVSYNSSDCQPSPTSVVELFYKGSNGCGLLSSKEVSDAVALLMLGLGDPVQKLQVGFFMKKGTVASPPDMTRSIIPLGYPLEGHETLAMDSTDMFSITKKFWERLEDDLLAYFGHKHNFWKSAYWERWLSGDVEVLLYSPALQQAEADRVVTSDTAFVTVAMLFVLTCLCWHSGSVFVGIVSLGQILFSVPVAFFFYRFILQVTFFQQLHAILMFIMLGVGADSVFVFSDAWHQSPTLLKEKKTLIPVVGDDDVSILAARIAIALQRTLVSVFNTSFTTGVAFLATAISPIMPIKTMGIFACLLVLVNYVFVISVTPAVFAVMHTYSKLLPSCRLRRRTEAGAASGEFNNFSKWLSFGNPLERWFFPTFRRPVVAVSCVVVLAAWAAANIYFALQLETPLEFFKYFSDDHMLETAAKLNTDGFMAGTGNDYLLLRVSFGIAGVDRSPGDKSVNQWAPHVFYGEPVYDNSFDLGSPDAQDYLRSFCKKIRKVTCTAEACSDGMLIQPGAESVSCFIEEFDTWNGGKRANGTEFLNLLEQFRATQKPKHMGNSWEQSIGFVDGRLRFVQVQAMMTSRKRLSSRLKEDILGVLEPWLETERQVSPVSAGSIIQTAGRDWVFYSLETALVEGLFTGFAVCFPVSFLVLLLATGNIVIAVLAVLTIFLIVMNVLGWCWFVEGWNLGVSESIAGVIVIGLSIDYVIHLGHMYLESAHLGCKTREQKWMAAFQNMGVTVLAGAVTTFMAAMSMRLCQMTFFLQMSTLMSVTIAYSLVYTYFFFMAILRLAGPEGTFGEIAPLLRWKSKGKGSGDEEVQAVSSLEFKCDSVDSKEGPAVIKVKEEPWDDL